MHDLQVAKLCPQHLRSPSADPFHITCVYFSRQGELLSTYNYEVRPGEVGGDGWGCVRGHLVHLSAINGCC
jgi:hypothetical protein